MARPHLRRRSNEGEVVPVVKRRGSGSQEGRTTRPALASFDLAGSPFAQAKAKQKQKANFEIFVDLGKRKRTSLERRGETGVPRTQEIIISSDEDESGSGRDQESSGTDDGRDDAYYLQDAIASELRRLDKTKLIDLARSATGQTVKALEGLTKTALADGIINKRAESSSSGGKRPANVRTLSLPSIGDLSISDRSPPRQRHARVTRSISDNTQQSGTRPTRFRQRSSGGSLPLSEDNRHVAFEEQIAEERSESSDDDGDDSKVRRWREPTPARWREPTPVAHRTRRRSDKTSATTTPALPKRFQSMTIDDEAEIIDVDGDDEEDGEHRSPRRLRNGKVVIVLDDDESESVESVDEVDELTSESESENELSEKNLTRLRRSDLVKLCSERDLDQDGTKKDLVDALVKWKEHRGDGDYVPPSSPSTLSTSGSPLATSKTPKHETKTQALAAIESFSSVLSPVPRLLASEAFSVDSNRPETPCPPSGEDVDEDVETLDLDSLGLTDKAIAPEKLKRGDKIGAGGFKDVYIGKFRNYKVAIADLRDGLTESDVKELLLLRDLQHANIVRFIGVSVPDDPRANGVPQCTLVTELCPNGDMYDYLRSGVEAPSQRMLFKMMLDIVSGLEYLHTRLPRIIHRDMKSSNVLITAKGVAKINDFGLARVKTSTRSVIKSLVGTVNWQAPELWAPKPKYNEKVDVYATGLVFWEMLQFHMPTKRYPFEGANDHAIYHDVGKLGLRPPTATMGRKWGSEILDLVDKMWAQQAVDRPSMTEVRIELENLIASL